MSVTYAGELLPRLPGAAGAGRGWVGPALGLALLLRMPGPPSAQADGPPAPIAAAPVESAGDLTLFFARVEDHAAVADARVTLWGRALDGRDVSRAATTDAEGRAAFVEVPPGVAYRARIDVPGLPSRFVEGLLVRRGLAVAALPIFVGPPSSLVGRFTEEDGAPAAGAVVRVFDEVEWRSGGLPVYDAGEELASRTTPDVAPLATAITDSAGGYRIDGLPSGPVVVRATAPTRRETVARVFLAPPGGAQQTVTRVLWRGGDVTGVVVDAGGRPVAGLEVAVQSATGGTDERRSTTTGADGRFALTVAHSGPFFVSASDATRRRHVSRRFQSPPPPLTIPWAGDVPFRLTVTDRVDGRALPDTSIELGVTPTLERVNGEVGWMTTVSGSTDAAGRFGANLPAGFLSSVVLTSPGHVGAAIDATWWIPNGDVETVQQLFGKELVARSALDVAVALPGAEEQDDAGIVGRVLDDEGRPVPGARVGTWSLGSLGPHVARTDEHGDFGLAGAAAEAFVVRARGFVQRAEERAGEVDPSPRRIVRVRRPATVRGRVVDAEGRGVADAQVSILPQRHNDRSISMEHRREWQAFRDPHARTAADGTFVMHDVVPLVSVPLNDLDVDAEGASAGPGPALLAVRARGYVDTLSAPFPYAISGGTPAPTVALSRGAHVAGRVVDAEGHPCANVPVSLEAIGEGTTHADLPADGHMHSGADGTFRVFALPVGELRVRTGAVPGHDGGTATIPVRGAGAMPAFDVVMPLTPPPGTPAPAPAPKPPSGDAKCG